MKLLVLHFFLTSSHFGDSAHIEAVLGCYGNRPSQVETRRVELKVSDGKVPLVTSVSGVIPAELRLEDLQEELKSLGELIVLLVVLQQKKNQSITHSVVRNSNFVTWHTRRNVSHNHGTHFTNP